MTIAGEAKAPCLDGAPLHLILQHASANAKPADIVSLLLTSRSMEAAVLDACKGQIHVQFTKAKQLDKVLAFTSWLAKYGQLASSMEFQPCLDQDGKLGEDALRGENALAVALQQAAVSSKLATATAESGSLQLRSCVLFKATVGISAVLEQLPASRLRSLDLHLYEHCPVGPSQIGEADPNGEVLLNFDPSPYLIPLSNSSSHLTTLQNLALEFLNECNCKAALNPMVQQLSALTQLSQLRLSSVNYNEPFFDALPASLKELYFAWDDVYNSRRKPLVLRHLTALTRLETDKSVVVEDSCVLPGSLVVLDVGAFSGGSYLRSLQNLQVILLQDMRSVCWHSRDGRGNLQDMTVLSALSRVEISTSTANFDDFDAAGLVWQSFPLKRLHVDTVEHALVHNLGSLKQLIELDLLYSSFECNPADTAKFAAALWNLTSLRSLKMGVAPLEGNFLQHPDQAAGLLTVCKALAGLDNLQELHIEGVSMGREAAQFVAHGVAHHLTALTLRNCDLDDCSLNVLLLHSLQLVKLNVSENFAIGDGVLPAVAKLAALTCLMHKSTRITREGLTMFVPNI